MAAVMLSPRDGAQRQMSAGSYNPLCSMCLRGQPDVQGPLMVEQVNMVTPACHAPPPMMPQPMLPPQQGVFYGLQAQKQNCWVRILPVAALVAAGLVVLAVMRRGSLGRFGFLGNRGSIFKRRPGNVMVGGNVVPMLEVTERPDGCSVRFEYRDRLYTYELEPANELTPHAEITFVREGIQEKQPPGCRTYHQHQDGHNAVIVMGAGTCMGIIQDGEEFYEVAPQGHAHLHAEGSPGSVTCATPQGQVHTVGPATQLTELRASLRQRPWNGQPFFPGCYPSDFLRHSFAIGIEVDVPAFRFYGSNRGTVEQSVIAIVSEASFVYEQQFNIRIDIDYIRVYETANGAPSFAAGCSAEWWTDKLNGLRSLNVPFEGAVHMISGCSGNVLGIAYTDTVCSAPVNVGVDQVVATYPAFLTFAHELGHNFGAGHSFENGQGTTGGIMDYADGRYMGEIQFNPLRRAEMCGTMSRVVNRCRGKFVPATQGVEPGTIRSGASPRSTGLGALALAACLCLGVRA